MGAVLLCAIARAPLGECHPLDFALFLSGRSGSQKSECAAFVVDDFAPSTNQGDANRLHGKAERLFRATGNQAGRGRRNSDLTGRPAYHPRGMVVATGEDNPRGASLLGRLLVVEMKRGDVDLDSLSGFQQLAREGHFAGVMAAYIQWLASQIDTLKRDLPKRIIAYRDEALQNGFAASHPRAADIYASLYAGAEIFMTFITETKVLPELDAAAILDDIDMHLRNAVKAQGDYQRQTDEVERFRELLRACFASGEAHVCNPLDQGQPAHLPYLWGWRKVDTIKDFDGDGGLLRERDIYAANGAGVGYLANHTGKNRETRAELWLEPQATFKAVQRFATQQGEPFLTSQATLWRRLQERNHLLECEFDAATGTHRPTAKRSTGGSRKRLLILSPGFVVEKDHPTGWDGEPQP